MATFNREGVTIMRTVPKAALAFLFCVLGVSACSIAPAPRTILTLGTGASGGAFMDYGPGVAKVVAAHSAIDLQSLPTAGSNENLALLADGRVQLALVNMGPAYEAWTGTEAWAGKRVRNIRALTPMYETPFHAIALASSGIHGVVELDGKRVGVGPHGGPAENFFRGLAGALGIKPLLVNGSPSDNAQQLLRGEIDAFWYGAGLPVGAFVDAARAQPVTVFGLTAPEVAVFRAKFPYLAPYTVPAGTYAGQDRALETAAVWNFILARTDLDDDTAYRIASAILDHPDEIARVYPAASASVVKNMNADTFLPLHPGAARYLRERPVLPFDPGKLPGFAAP